MAGWVWQGLVVRRREYIPVGSDAASLRHTLTTRPCQTLRHLRRAGELAWAVDRRPNISRKERKGLSGWLDSSRSKLSADRLATGKPTGHTGTQEKHISRKEREERKGR